MKKIITSTGKFGPYESVEVLEDRYRVDGPSDLPFTVVGQGEITDVVDGDFPPSPYVAPVDVATPALTKEELMAQITALSNKIQALE
tara:strand:+ start:1588 stop:1848 length:261 start_codon:yes stop_codon:yes gene_type:complete